MPATIKDVALEAGCSITTVSRAFSDPDMVKKETLARIEDAAKRLCYSPNAIAQAMVKQKIKAIAFVIHERHYPILQNMFYAAISESVQEYAQERGYTLYIVSSADFERNMADIYCNKRVDGVILAGQHDKALADALIDRGTPVVLINSAPDQSKKVAVSVNSDDYGGTLNAIDHLVAKGHRRIGMVSGDLYSFISNIRQKAFIDGMARHELPIYPHCMLSAEADVQKSMAAVSALFSKSQPPTALFCMNDIIAIGAIKAALRAGLSVPKDLAVVGFDNSSLCTIIEPELTSVSVDTRRMGKYGAKALFELIAGGTPEQTSVCLQTKLIERQST